VYQSCVPGLKLGRAAVDSFWMSLPTTYRPLRGRAQVVVALLVVTGLISCVSILYQLDLQALLDRLAAGRPVGSTEMQSADDRTALIDNLSLAAGVCTSIAFVAWFFRAYQNIERLGARGLRVKPGWAIGSWFVPILNLFRPKQIMNDIWRASDPALPAAEARGWQHGAVPGLLHWWWAAFLIGGSASNMAGLTIETSATVPAQQSAATLAVFADGGRILAAALAVLVVRAVTSRQEGRATRVAGGGLSTGIMPFAAEPSFNTSKSIPPPTAA
jgi:hypothetical protein